MAEVMKFDDFKELGTDAAVKVTSIPVGDSDANNEINQSDINILRWIPLNVRAKGEKLIDHFRVAFSLCFKARLSANPFK